MFCSKCKLNKDENQFGFKNKTKLIKQSHCKVCNATYQHEWYLRNTSVQIQRSKLNKIKFLEWTRSLKNKPCVDCNVQYPYYVMEWDHLGLEPKLDNVSSVVRKVSKTKFLAEIAKCDLVCANCHRQRTHTRFQSGL